MKSEPTSMEDNIAVLQTPGATGAIAVIVLDGPEAPELFAREFRAHHAGAGEKHSFASGRLRLGEFGPEGQEILAGFLDAAESGTGHREVEVNCHGGVAATEACMATLDTLGFRRAPGEELIARSIRRGNTDIIELELRLEMLRPLTSRQLRFVTHAAEELRSLARRRLGREHSTVRALKKRAETETPTETPSHARALMSEHHVAIFGPRNAGKSTLMNRLCRTERVIVSPSPGTTRDVVDTLTDIRGLAVRLSDGAGVGSGKDSVFAKGRPDKKLEREAETRARKEAGNADLTLVVLDGSTQPGAAEREALEAPARRKYICLLNKSDVGLADSSVFDSLRGEGGGLEVSALRGDGIEELERRIEAELLDDTDGPPFAWTNRQAAILERLESCGTDDKKAGTYRGKEARRFAALLLGVTSEGLTTAAERDQQVDAAVKEGRQRREY